MCGRLIRRVVGQTKGLLRGLTPTSAIDSQLRSLVADDDIFRGSIHLDNFSQ